jgi:membrane-bound lytic murein transglycosylase MltF
MRKIGPTTLSVFVGIITFYFTMANVTFAQDEQSILKLDKKWTGNFDAMVKRRLIRALVPLSKTFYFFNGAEEKGITYDAMMEFEHTVNKNLGKGLLPVRLVVIPTSRDRLLSGLLEGLGDIAAGDLTITPERQRSVDFSDPAYTDVDEIVVTGPKSPRINRIGDLAGKAIHVRASSSYYESLNLLNARFRIEGKKPVKIVLADENLDDEDLLEMLNAGLIPLVVIKSPLGKFWARVFKDITLHPDIKLRAGDRIAWAIRKNSPRLKKVINGFIKTHKEGTLMGNILLKRYLENTDWVRDSFRDEDLKRFRQAAQFFQKYGKQYDFDWLMIAAQAYQESRIDQSKRSSTGAIGVMQVLPSTAKDPNVDIPHIEELEPNVHAGVKYLRFIRNRYFEDQPMNALNKTLFSFASYNAGPAEVASLRQEAKEAGFDPNIWFRNVEIIAAKRIGRETVQYVSNIFKYYIAYGLATEIMEKR